MKFEIDKQTLEDLNLLGKFKSNSIFSLFNHTVTRGGEILLERMFHNPFIDETLINERSSILNLFQESRFEFTFSKEELGIVEFYIGNPDHKNFLISFSHNVKRKALKLLTNSKEFDIHQQGLLHTVKFIKRLEKQISAMSTNDKVMVNPYNNQIKNALTSLHSKRFDWIYLLNEDEDISFLKMALYDYKLRYLLSEPINRLMEILYEMDLYITVSTIGRERGFNYAVATGSHNHVIDIKGVYHPAITNAISNDIHLADDLNVIFLTGANMAGKSTLMKSFGVSLYLAHMGFPAPIESMIFSVRQGLYTSINVPDDIHMGYSHFYAEVVRVKKIAVEAASGKSLVIMFDELFKGTNVKDAYDATVAITGAFSDIKECAFIVSTHIMEAGLTLKEEHSNIQFKYLPTEMDGNIPTYSYKLDDGISDDRHGMRIITNENIIEIIKRKSK